MNSPLQTLVRFTLAVALALGLSQTSSALAGEKSIVVAQSIDLSGPNGAIGHDYVAGLTSYFDSVNQSGGVNGRKIRFIVRDDHGDANLAIAATRELIEQEKPQYLLGGIGPEVTRAVLGSPAFLRSNLMMFAPLTDAQAAFGNRALVWRPSKEQEMQYIFSYFDKLGIKNIGVAYGDSPYYQEAWAYVAKEIHQRGMKLTGSIQFSSNNPAPQALKLAQTRPDIVICLLDTINTGLFLKSFRKHASKTFVAGTSLTNLATLAEIAGNNAMEWTVFSQVVPNPNAASSAIQIEHAKTMRKFRDEAISSMTFEGFAVAKTLVHAMQNTPGNGSADLQTLTRSNIDLGGLRLVRTDGAANLSQFVDIALFRRGGSLLY